MNDTRKVEIFSAGCPVCDDAVSLVQDLACSSCEIDVLDMSNPGVARRAETLGVESLPAVAIDGELAECCTRGGLTKDALQAEGIGQPIT